MRGRTKTMRPSRCSLLQPQEELQVGIHPRSRITVAVPGITSTKSKGFYGVFFFLVSFAVVDGVVSFFLVSFTPPAVPLYALP